MVANNTQRRQSVVSDAIFQTLPPLRPCRCGHLSRRLEGHYRYLGVNRHRLITPSSPRPLERPVEVDADAVSSPAGVFLGQSKHEGAGVAQCQPFLTDADASLRLTEENDVRWERKIAVVIQRIAAQKFRRLHD